ncbi:uncharacterized protein LOC116341952 isoform X2 [Contarinia nasturtii]|uniref:uncharacterized protein LOC116341952 isoform X2 n=1 Tax=Contarinia nasturtii TaxID=265458 RepID=UPI0012D3B127|nr:uncharacterized protein LOC116341952 isoform X2 [Contarinia nasturtii]
MRRVGCIKSIFNRTNTSYVILAVIVALNAIATDVAAKWPTHKQELQDEVDDMRILNAVQQSMYEYEKSHRYHHRHKRAEKRVCYDELGCFEDSGPFGYLDMLPQSPEEIGTKFYFYSTENRSDKPLLEIPYLNMSRMFHELSHDKEKNSNATTSTTTVTNNNNNNTAATPIDSKFPSNSSDLTPELMKNIIMLKTFEGFDRMSVRVIVHGFGAACHHVWIYEMRTALMAVEDCIVICVDWEAGASLPNYVRAAANTRLIGKQLSLLMRGLQEHKGLNLNHVHIIGFSLGAHVSGFAGSELPGLKRITGLDPAGPLFESQHIRARLDSSDANFVDVIHSNGENLILGGLGSWQPMGDADFYPNGGRVQTGCSNIFVGAVTDFIWSPSVVEGRSLCNHRRAYKFFIDSIASKCLFPAFPCDTYDDFLKGNCFPCDDSNYRDSRCGNMGYYADKSTGRGQLYLVTREEEPFCAHQFHIEIHTSESDLPLRTIGKIEATLHGEHSLNETFSITDKDDAELFAGDVISRILVPHPALGFPKSVSLTYKTYSGWLSKGLPHWNINKIVLTDSFGASYSMCRNYMLLESGNPVSIKLQSGVCEITEENDVTFTPFETDNPKNVDGSGGGSVDDVDKLREKKNVLNLGTNYKITNNKTYVYANKAANLPWQPALENGNSLERNSAESSRSLQTLAAPGEIFEPILKDRPQPKPHTGRSFNIDGEKKTNVFAEEEIMEPILKATTARSRKMKQVPMDASMTRDNSYFNVQLLPFRLGEIFQRAERYARETLLPLISEQAPRFFGFGIDREEPNQRRPKYIPKIDSADDEFDTEFNDPNEKHTTMANIADIKRSDQNEAQNVVIDSRGTKNILSLLRIREKRTTSSPLVDLYANRGRSMPSASSEYYTNADAIKNDDNLKVVRINLPTYKPSTKALALSGPFLSPKAVRRHSFPYQFEIPADPL